MTILVEKDYSLSVFGVHKIKLTNFNIYNRTS